MLAWRPGARSSAVERGRGPETSDAGDGALLIPRLGRGRRRPAADLYPSGDAGRVGGVGDGPLAPGPWAPADGGLAGRWAPPPVPTPPPRAGWVSVSARLSPGAPLPAFRPHAPTPFGSLCARFPRRCPPRPPPGSSPGLPTLFPASPAPGLAVPDALERGTTDLVRCGGCSVAQTAWPCSVHCLVNGAAQREEPHK